MRPMLLPLLVAVVLPQAQRGPLTLRPTLAVTTARPRVDLETLFTFSGSAKAVTWDFGDGRPPQAGGNSISHVYRREGTFQVKATAGSTTVEQSVTVVEPRRILATPTVPGPGKAATLRLEEALGKSLRWSFGDGSVPVSGGASIAHTFAKEGDYVVTVQDLGGERGREFKLDLSVGRQGPGAVFGVTYLALRWEDGAAERSVSQGETGLVAFADLKFEGTGQLQAEWLVDGQVQRAVSQQLGFAKLATLQSGQLAPLRAVSRQGRHTLATAVPGEFKIELPTNVAGEHKVALRVLQPRLAFQVPVLRYFVTLGGSAKGPMVQSLSPATARPGEEVELVLTGTGFTSGMALNLGKDVAVLGAPRVLSPERAVVKIFVAPTAQPGARAFQARKAGGGGSGPAQLQILPSGKPTGSLVAKAVAGATKPQSGELPASRLKGGLPETPKTVGALGLVKADERGKRPPVAAGLRAHPVELGKVSRSGAGFSKFAPPSGGKGLGLVVDAGARRRKEKVLACTEGQRLKLSQITQSSPYFTLIGVNTSGEFQSDDLPVLRDSTQFSWKEKNPGTSEYFELSFYTARNGALLKTVRVPGNRSSFDVTPAIVQELGQLYTANTVSAAKGLAGGAARAGAPATVAQTPKTETAKGKGGKRGLAGARLVPVSAGTASPSSQAQQLDPPIPAPMAKKAHVVWQVVGFRSYPCLSPEELEAQTPPRETDRSRPKAFPGRGVIAPLKVEPLLRPTPTEPLQTKARTGRSALRGSKAEAAGKPVLTGRSSALDEPITAQNQAPSKLSEAPKVYRTVVAEVSRSGLAAFRMPVTPQGVNPKSCTIGQNDPKVVLEANKAAREGTKSHYGLQPAFSAIVQAGKARRTRPAAAQKSSTVLDENTYTFDEIWLHGTFDLGANVPYRLIPSSVQYSGSGGGQGTFNVQTVDSVAFRNVFVDWGDGTLEPFRAKPMGTLYKDGTDYGSAYKLEPGAYRHSYARSSTYRVKVFVLSDEDMVRGDIVDEVSQALTPSQSVQGLFTRLSGHISTNRRGAPALQSIKPTPLVTRSGPAKAKLELAPAFGTHAGAFLDMRPTASQALGRAYVLYCHDLIVKDREDPCANAPVHLVSARLEFPQNEPPSSKSAKVLGGAPQRPQALQKAPAQGSRKQPSGSLPSLAGQTARLDGKLGPMNAASAQDAKAALAPQGPNPPSTTPCNLFYSALTRIGFYGQGTVRVIWKVDERQVGSREVVVKSPKRVGLKADEAQTCKSPLLGEVALNSPALPVDSLGRHIATVEAYVLPDKTGDLDAEDLENIGHLAAGRPLSAPMSPRLVHTLVDGFGKRAGKPPVRLGLINPSQAPGQAAFVSLNRIGGLASGTGLQRASNGALLDSLHLQPPYRVETRGVYEVKATQGDKICNLFFPTKGGNFPVTNLGSTLKLVSEGALQKASGEGLLIFGLKAGTAPDTVAPYPLSVSFSDWRVDGITVAKGQIDLQPNQTYDGPGVNGKLLKVHGEIADKNAPQDMKATLELSPTDTSMVLTSDGRRRPVWTAEAPVTTQGDWIAKGLKLETTVLGPTPWAFEAEDVTIDLSGVEGADPKGGKSPDWVGVKLGTVTLIPSTLGIQGGEWTKPLPHPTDWTIEGLGVKGRAEVGPWHTAYRNGHLAIASIHFKAQDGHYAAAYKDVEIRSPWFKDPIKGDASWVRMESGTYMLNLDKLHVAKRPVLAGGPMALEPLDLQFTRIENGGLLMQGRAHISLRAEDKPIATFDADRVGFGLDGLLYFGDDGARSATVTLNRASALGFTPADLQNAVLTGGNAKETPLALKLNAKLRLSENPVIPGTPATLNFGLRAEGTPGLFTAPEVKVDPFSTEVAFPLGSPSLKAKVNTNYQPGGTAGGAPAMPSNRFSGDVDLSMFGGAPVRAQFVLGYDKGKDYFATRVDVPLGPSGVVIYPEVVSLFRLSGGFAYNFGLDVFKDGGSIANAKPDFKGETLFMAGARLGSADGFIYTLDGQLAVKSSGAARMDFGAWLLSATPSGTAPLRGCLEYSGGNFDGRIWGGFHFLGDTVALELGPSEQAAACSLHFGSGNWHIYAGNRDGQRIVGRLLGDTSNVYLMLGNEVGLAVGGGRSWYLGAGVGVKAYAKGWMDMGFQITPQARMVGDFGAGLEAGACAFGHCVSAGVNAHVHAEALPLAMSASCCVDLPWPLSEICFTVKM